MQPTTYTALLHGREFRALFTAQVSTVASQTVSSLALATLVDAATGSPMLTALSMFGPTFAHVLGATALMSHADTDRPRRLLIALRTGGAATLFAQMLDIGLPARFGLLLAAGLLGSVASGLSLGLLREATPDTGYAPARSLFNIATGTAQIVGFAAAAVLLTAATPRQLFLAAALLALASCAPLTGVRERSIRVVARPGLRRTAAVNRWIRTQRHPRALIAALALPNGLVVGCEALFVPFAGNRAGILLVGAAAGMLTGDLTAGRLLPAPVRRRLILPLRLLLAAPYLAFAAGPGPWAAAALAAVASVGFAASLGLQEALVDLTPDEMIGQVQGVESSGRMVLQGVCAAAAGGLAELIGVEAAITAMAALSLISTAVLARSTLAALAAASPPVPNPSSSRLPPPPQ